MSLRRRVFAYVAAAALASCLLTVGVAVVLVRHRVSAQRVTALQRDVDVLASSGLAHVYRAAGGRLLRIGPFRASRVLTAISATSAPQGTVTIAGRSFLYAQRRIPAGRVVVIRSGALAFGEWRPFLGSLLLAGLGGALLAALLAYLLARRLTRPIAALLSATGRVTAGQTEVSVAVQGDDELAELGRSFNEMSSSLAQARGAQRRFLESVSHELKTPLTSIRGYAEALREGAVGPARAGSVIESEAGRLERLVADLLDLARLQRAEFEVRRDPVDLAELGTRAVQRHSPRAEALGVSLVRESAGGAPAVGDADRLVQSVSNLIENALRVTPAGGSVTVRAEPGAISVTDTGPGLDADDLPRAFERFYLYDRYKSERPVGSGLGLALVRELADRMGGRAEVRSTPGRGTTFRIVVPRG